MRRRTHTILAELTFVALLPSLGSLPMLGSAATVWSDSFDDGNYDGWTTRTEGFTCDNQYLECTTNTTPPTGWNIIERACEVNSGTWTFDFYQVVGSWWFGFYVQPVLALAIGGRDNEIALVKGATDLAVGYVEIRGDWHHFDVTLTSCFQHY